jgi:hypothetical protein
MKGNALTNGGEEGWRAELKESKDCVEDHVFLKKEEKTI